MILDGFLCITIVLFEKHMIDLIRTISDETLIIQTELRASDIVSISLALLHAPSVLLAIDTRTTDVDVVVCCNVPQLMIVAMIHLATAMLKEDMLDFMKENEGTLFFGAKLVHPEKRIDEDVVLPVVRKSPRSRDIHSPDICGLIHKIGQQRGAKSNVRSSIRE